MPVLLVSETDLCGCFRSRAVVWSGARLQPYQHDGGTGLVAPGRIPRSDNYADHGIFLLLASTAKAIDCAIAFDDLLLFGPLRCPNDYGSGSSGVAVERCCNNDSRALFDKAAAGGDSDGVCGRCRATARKTEKGGSAQQGSYS